jgi:hypothetical protein
MHIFIKREVLVKAFIWLIPLLLFTAAPLAVTALALWWR